MGKMYCKNLLIIIFLLFIIILDDFRHLWVVALFSKTQNCSKEANVEIFC